MRLSEGVEWGLHCAVLVALVPPGQALSAGRLAEYHGVPTPYLAKHLQALSRERRSSSRCPARGAATGSPDPPTTSACSTSSRRIDGTDPPFECTEIRRRGPTRLPAREYRVPCSIHAVMATAEQAWRGELRRTSIADLVGMVGASAPPAALVKGLDWFQEVLR